MKSAKYDRFLRAAAERRKNIRFSVNLVGRKATAKKFKISEARISQIMQMEAK
jgi:hypothetical protein